MIESVVKFIERILALNRYSDENAFELKLIFDEYELILRELYKVNSNLYEGEMNAFSDMFGISDLLITGKTTKTKQGTFETIKSGLLADLKEIYYRLTGHIYNIKNKI